MNKLKEDSTHEGTIEFSNNGNASIIIDEKSIFIFKKNTLNALNSDKVKVKIIIKSNKVEAEVIEVLKRFRTKFVGKVHINKDLTFVIPDSQKIPVDFYIKGDHDAKLDQKVLVELTGWEPGSKSPKGKIIEIIGNSGENNAEMNSIMYEYGLPNNFPLMIEADAELISEVITESEISKRRDLRNVITIGIDPFDSKDADDTIGLEFINGERFISINIADVTHYITEGSDLDEEAYSRGSSVYLVDRCVPMLPKRLSNGICSLKSGSDKLSYSAIFKVSDDGIVLDRWFGRTVINVNKDYSYEQAQDVIENGVKDSKEIDEVIIELDRIAKLMRSRRVEDSLELNSIEVKFILDEVTKKPTGVYFKEQKDSNKLIEEYMLLANKEVSTFIKSKNLPCVNRIHESPDEDKLQQFKDFVNRIGYEFEIGDVETTKKSFNSLVKEAKDTPEQNIINTLVTRVQKKAVYSTKNLSHYGLNFDDYSHFTSPIRRYSDMITHRLLTMALNNVNKSDKNKVEIMCKHISSREILASRAERESIKYKQMEFLEDKIGSVFDGIVSGITDWGMCVELIESKCEGMVRYNNNYTVDTANYVVFDKMGGSIRLGDEVKVVVKSVDLDRKQIDFEIF
jgi:ribonuclease R